MKKKNSKPLYEQVMNELSRDIAVGRFRVGDLIPTESELCERFHVSRITVRRSVEELSKKGILKRRQGKGTFVMKSSAKATVSPSVLSFHHLCEELGKEPSVTVLKQEMEKAKKEDQKALLLPSADDIVSVVRLCHADGVPVAYAVQCFTSAFSFLLDCDLTGSIYELAGSRGAVASSSLRTVSLTRADETVAESLAIKEGDPLILLHFIVYNRQGIPMNVTDAFVRGDVFPIRFQ